MIVATTRERLGAFFGAGELWERPGPTPAQRRNDVWLGLALWVVGALVTELLRIMGVLDGISAPVWLQHVAVASGTLVLAARRTFPVAVAAFAGLHLFFFGVTAPAITSLAPLQVGYFLAVFSAVAWARDRQQMALVVGSVVLLLFLWLAAAYAWGSGLEEMLGAEGAGHPLGPITPALAAGVYGFLVNAAYFGGAIGLGQHAWRAARQTAQVAEQKAIIQAQAERLREQAVTEERLRIARELHDVVAHHVSVMGVQAAAARAVLARDPQRSAEALRSIEQSSREAVNQMRGLLGTLRQGGGTHDEASERAPQPASPTSPSLCNRLLPQRLSR
jgi:signal transduction histidine kinase